MGDECGGAVSEGSRPDGGLGEGVARPTLPTISPGIALPVMPSPLRERAKGAVVMRAGCVTVETRGSRWSRLDMTVCCAQIWAP